MTNNEMGATRLSPGDKAEKVREVITLLEAAIRQCERYLRSLEEEAGDLA